MPRPDFVTNEDIKRWDYEIDKLGEEISKYGVVREVCYAGLYLCECLEELKCPNALIVRIQYTAAKCSFGKDPWDVHLKFIEDFKDNKLDFETEDKNNLN